MNITLMLQIEHPEDLTLVEQLAQRLHITYHIKKKKGKGMIFPKSSQLQVFEKMEALRIKLQAVPVPTDIDISQLANEVNMA